MLWYKALLETRSRFLIALVGSIVLCSSDVYHWNKQAMSYTEPYYYYTGLHEGHSILCVIWVLAVTLLTMGGLLREKAAGTVPFTLALPVTRARLTAVRVAVGFLQAIALGIFPWMAMVMIDGLAGKAYSIYQALFHLVLLVGGGTVFLGTALLVSSVVEGEYTAPIVTFGAVLTTGVLVGRGPLKAYNPWGFIVGAEYFDGKTGLMIGPIPWVHAAVSILVGATFVAIAAKALEARDF